MTLKEFFICLRKLTKYLLLTGSLFLFLSSSTKAQLNFLEQDFSLLEMRLHSSHLHSFSIDDTLNDQENQREEFPDPKHVLFRSLIIPGWGQVINRQVWKVPIIYALFAGVGYYNYTLRQQYHGYRAAYYNTTRGADSDFKYGPTPDFIPEELTSQQLRETRDNLRNRRDFSYVIMAMAYGLNALDAYVYAHMRSFDVSDDLSASTAVGPAILESGMPGINIRVNLNMRNNNYRTLN